MCVCVFLNVPLVIVTRVATTIYASTYTLDPESRNEALGKIYAGLCFLRRRVRV